MSITLYFIFIIILLLMSSPIALALIIPSIFYFILNDGVSLSTACARIINAPNSFPILAVPFFILMGNIMNSGGITKRIFNFARSIMGHYPGGLAHANVLASMLFSGMSGAAMADAAGLGMVEIEAMTKEGYDLDFSCAVTVASSTIGPIFPPSVPLVMYGVAAQVSIGKLLIGGVIPGFLIAVTLMIMIYYMSRTANFPISKRSSIKEILNATKESFLANFTIVILLAGIIWGVTTPTEAAVIATVYSLFLSSVIYGELTIKTLIKNLQDSVRTIGSVMLIVAGAMLFAWIITVEKIPFIVSNVFLSLSDNPYVFLFLINILLLIVGCFITPIAAIIILVPIILPTVKLLGIDLVHFGLVMVLNLMIGLSTPPMGLVLFVIVDIAQISFKRLVRAMVPFYIPLLIVLLLITYIPFLVTYLPKLLME